MPPSDGMNKFERDTRIALNQIANGFNLDVEKAVKSSNRHALDQAIKYGRETALHAAVALLHIRGVLRCPPPAEMEITEAARSSSMIWQTSPTRPTRWVPGRLAGPARARGVM